MASEDTVDPNVTIACKVLAGFTILFCLIGIVGNVLLAKKYYTKKNLKLLFPCLIVYLAFCDIIYLICTTVMAISYQAGATNENNPTFYTVMNFPSEIAFSGSIITTVLAAIERCAVFYQDV